MIVNVNLSSDVAHRLAQEAAGQGKTLEAYLQEIAEKRTVIQTVEPSAAETEYLLDELSAAILVKPPTRDTFPVFSSRMT